MYDYLFPSSQDRLHVDYYTAVEQLRMIRFNFPLAVDFVVTRMINEEQQDEVFVAVHEGTCVGVCEVWVCEVWSVCV